MKIRWSAKGKLDVMKRLDNGVLSEHFVRNILEISDDELAEWRRDYAARGIHGLKTTKRTPRRNGVT